MYNFPFEDFESSPRSFPSMPGGQFPGGGSFPPGGPFPPGGFPPQSGGGFSPPFGPPFGGQNQPSGPPPSFVPVFPSAQAYASGSMSRCLFRNTYVWLRNGNSFWFYPISVTRNTIIGFRWSSRRGWLFRSINRNNILTFTCFFF